MKAAFLVKERTNFEIREIPTPSPQDDEVLVRVKYALITNEDWEITAFQGQEGIAGRYFVGEVVGAGPKVKNVTTGEIVSAFPAQPCGECIECKRDNQPFCEKPKILGYNTQGILSEYIKVRENYLIKIPTEIPLELGVFVPLVSSLATLIPHKIEYGITSILTADNIEHIIFSHILLNCGIWQIALLSNHNRLRTFVREASRIYYTEESSNLYGIVNDLIEKPKLSFELTGDQRNLKCLIRAMPADTTIIIWNKFRQKISYEPEVLGECTNKELNLTLANRIPSSFHSNKAIKLILLHELNLQDFVTHNINLSDFSKVNIQSIREPVLMLVRMQ